MLLCNLQVYLLLMSNGSNSIYSSIKFGAKSYEKLNSWKQPIKNPKAEACSSVLFLISGKSYIFQRFDLFRTQLKAHYGDEMLLPIRMD